MVIGVPSRPQGPNRSPRPHTEHRTDPYERARPGELIHIDVKKLGRIHGGACKRITGIKRNPGLIARRRYVRQRKTVGWDYVHIAIDDATRMAYAEVLADERAITAVGFLGRAIAFYARYGMTVER